MNKEKRRQIRELVVDIINEKECPDRVSAYP